MVAEEVTVSLSGGAPWGFRLQGGAEHQKPLQVAKVRRRSKACRAGLKEDDELVAIEEQNCMELSHAQAMGLIDMQSSTLNLKVKRASSLPGVPLSAPPPCSSSLSLPSWAPARCITSPPDSEAYYGETDSDADTQTPTHRRPRRTPTHPHARSPARHDSQEETETSEMSGYESAPDGGASLQGHTSWELGLEAQLNGSSLLPGVPRREVVYQPPVQQNDHEWLTSSAAHTMIPPHTLTPTPGDTPGGGGEAPLQMVGEGELGEEADSGFQEAVPAYVLAPSAVPLVSRERASEAMMLMGSASQLVPMVGPQHTPMSEDLSTTYMEKARQAKLQRGESVVEKQVKEARTKCRSIASLLTDAPNPNSKGVLMFKKRRQRAKKYTLTCFGKAEGDTGTETEGETEEEEGGSSFLSGSEVDEDGFSAAFDPTWDTGYLETLDRRSSACPSSTVLATPATTPIANHSLAFDTSAYQSPAGFVNSNLSPRSEYAGADGSAYPGSRSDGINGWYLPIGAAGPNCNPAPMSPPAVSMYNGGSVAVARASVVLSPPASAAAPPPTHAELHQNHYPANPAMTPDLCSNPGGSLNRTARPFTPGPSLSRSSVAPVLFRPPQPTATRPAAAVSMVNIPPTRTQQPPPPGPESRRSVSSASLYISPRNGNGGSSVYSPPMVHSPPASMASGPFYHPPAHAFPPAEAASPFSPPPPAVPQGPPVYPSAAQAFAPHPPPPPYSGMSASASSPHPQPPAPAAQVYVPPAPQVYAPPAPQPPPQATGPPPPPQFFNPYAMASPAVTQQQQQPPFAAVVATTAPPQAPPSHPPPPPTADSLDSREQRVSVPAARTGILAEARRRSNQKKPMFCSVQNKDVNPNPALLSMLQNIDDQEDEPVPAGPSFLAHNGSGPGPAASAEAGGHESGPEEDWLRLGAEACNFMQARKGPRAPPVAPKPQQAAAVPQLGGKGGQLFARRQSRMDRYMEERSPSVASVAAPYSPAQPRDASPTPSLPATWRYNSTCRAPPPINYNPLLSPSCPLKAQKTQKAGAARAAPGGGAGKGKGKGAALSAVDIMSHQPYQLNASLFTYGGGVPQSFAPQAPAKTARVREVKRFSTPPPMSTGPSLKVIAPRSATTLGEPMMWRSDDCGAPPAAPAPYQAYQPPPQVCSYGAPYQPQWGAAAPLSPPHPPAPTGPLPQLPTFSSPAYPSPPTFTHLQQQPDRQFKSSPDLSPLGPNNAGPSRPVQSSGSQGVPRVPRPRFSTSNLGLQPCVWRPGSNMN